MKRAPKMTPEETLRKLIAKEQIALMKKGFAMGPVTFKRDDLYDDRIKRLKIPLKTPSENPSNRRTGGSA